MSTRPRLTPVSRMPYGHYRKLIARQAFSYEEHREEFRCIDYTPAVGTPADADVTFRCMRMQDGRVIKLVVLVTCYNEDGSELQRSLEGIAANLGSMQALGYSWKEIAVVVIVDGEEKANPSLLEYAEQKLKVFDGSLMASKRKDGKPVTMHFFESSCQISEYKLSNSYHPPLQIIFALKARNGGKLNSHLWLLSAVVPQLNPKYVIMIDVGTRPADTSMAALVREMELDPKIGACAGEITVRNLKYFNVLQSAQAFEYKLSHILSKAAESVWGYVSVLPGAFSAYRWEAMRGAPLKRYFTTEETSIALLGPFWGNASLAEDRLLCAEILAKKGCDWKLTWIKGARAETDTPMALPELIRQRRRWLNGALFVQVLFLAEFSRFLYGTAHPLWRKALLCLQFVINAADTILAWFTSGLFFLSLLVIYKGVLDRMAGVDRTDIGQRTFDPSMALFVFGFLYCCVFLLLVLTSLVGNVGNLRTFYFSVTLYYALVMALGLCGTAWLLWSYVQFDLALTLTVALSTGAYVFTPLLHGELKTAFMTITQFFLMLPIYVNMFMVHSIANLHDISWGTKSGGLIREQRRALQAEAKREAKRAERAQQVIQDVIEGAHEADVSPTAAGMQPAASASAAAAESAPAQAAGAQQADDAVAAAVREEASAQRSTTSSSPHGANDSTTSVPEDRTDQDMEQFGVQGDSDLSDEASPTWEVGASRRFGGAPGRRPGGTRSAKMIRASNTPPRVPATTTGGRDGKKTSFGWASDLEEAPRPKTAGTLPATHDDSGSDDSSGRGTSQQQHSAISRRSWASRHAGAGSESGMPVDDIDRVLQHSMDAHKRTKSSKDLLEAGQVMVHGPQQVAASSAKLQSLVRHLGIPASSVESAAGRGLSGAVLNAEEYDEMIGDSAGSSPCGLANPNHASAGRASASQVQFAASSVLRVADEGDDLDMPESAGDADDLAAEDEEGLASLHDTQTDIELIQEAVRIAEAHRAAAQRAKDRAKSMAMDKDRLKEEFNVFRLRVLAAWLISNALLVGVVIYYSWVSHFSVVLAVVIAYAAGIRLVGTVVFQLHRLVRNVFRRACCCCYRRDVFTGKPRCCCRQRNYYRHDHKWMQQVGLLQPMGRGGTSTHSTHGTESDSDSSSEIAPVKLVNPVGVRTDRAAGPAIAQPAAATPAAVLQYNTSYGATPLVTGLGAASPAASISSDVGTLEQRAAQRGVSGDASQRFSALGLAQPGQLQTGSGLAAPAAAALGPQPLKGTPARQLGTKTAVTASVAIAAMRARAGGAGRSALPNAPEEATVVPLFTIDYDDLQEQDSLSSSSMSTDYSVASSIGSATSSRRRRGRHRRRTRGAGWQAFDPARFSSREKLALPGGQGSPESASARGVSLPPLTGGVPAAGSNAASQTSGGNSRLNKADILAEAAWQAMQDAPLVRRHSSSIVTSPGRGVGRDPGFIPTPSLGASRRGAGELVSSGARDDLRGVPKDASAPPVAARGSPNQSARIRLLKVVQSRGTTASRAAYRNMYGEATVGETLQRSPAHAQQRRPDGIPEEETSAE